MRGAICLFAGTHCVYPRRDGQAELTWVAGSIPRCFIRLPMVTHPSTNLTRQASIIFFDRTQSSRVNHYTKPPLEQLMQQITNMQI